MSHQQRHNTVPHWAKLWSSLLAASAVIAVSFVAVATSQQAAGQIAALDPALCATTYKPTTDAGDGTEADCRTLVAWRNQAVSNPGSMIGPNHALARWGTGATTTFNEWPSIEVHRVQGELRVTKMKMRSHGLAGPLPGNLPKIQEMRFNKNFLTGGLPSWIYSAQDLTILDLRSNRFSGTVIGSAFNTTKLWSLSLQHNLFSGPVPNFNFANLSKLVDLRLSNNDFSGSFPASWDHLDDTRGWQRLQVASNNITGTLPSSVLSLTFANAPTGGIGVGANRDFYVDFRNNSLCMPADFALPDYRKLDNTPANVQVYFGDNNCPTQSISDSLLPPPAENVRFSYVDASGNPTSTNPTGLKVTWGKPSSYSASDIVTYQVKLSLDVPAQDNFLGQENRESGLYCLSEHLTIPKVTNAQSQNEMTITSTSSRCPNFDPEKYSPFVVTTITNANGLTFEGNSPIRRDWSVYIADDPQKTYKDVAGVLGLDYQRNIWRWDAVNQAWQQRSQLLQDFSSLRLEPGSALAVEKRVLPSWLTKAGLSSADADTPVELQNGWNVISAGGSAAREAYEDGAYFIGENLIDCDSNQGVIAILRHVAGTQRFDIELPCHPSRESAITRGQAFRTISEIEELDTLFVYFRSALPVTVNWDKDNERYAPAS